MNLLRIGVLGCANIAQRSVIPAIQSLPKQFELVAVASRTLNKAEQFAQRFNCEAIEGYENMVKRTDIDALYIPLPTGLHYEWITKTLQTGKHVLCEKSLVSNYLEAQEVIAFAKSKQLLLMENFMFEHHSQHQYVFDLINKGIIGEIRCFRSSFGFPPFRDSNNIRYQQSLGGGALLDAGGYPTKAAQLFLGQELEVQGSFLHYHPLYKVDIYGGAFLKNKNNGTFAEIAFGFDNFYQCNYEIWGSKGKITAQRAFTPGPSFKPTIIIEQQDNTQHIQLSTDNHFVNILQKFYNTIINQNYKDILSKTLNQSRLLSEIKQQSHEG